MSTTPFESTKAEPAAYELANKAGKAFEHALVEAGEERRRERGSDTLTIEDIEAVTRDVITQMRQTADERYIDG